MSIAPNAIEERSALAADEELVHCPSCGSADVRTCRRLKLSDYLLSMFSFTALRCRNCRCRFHRQLWDAEPETSGHPESAESS